MTYQERWAEGPPVGPAELLTPKTVRFMAADLPLYRAHFRTHFAQLCDNYVTLWQRNKELEALTADLEAQVMDYATQVKESKEKLRTYQTDCEMGPVKECMCGRPDCYGVYL